MHSSDDVVRVAVVADVDELSTNHRRLLEALSQSAPAGFVLQLPGQTAPLGSRPDLIQLLTPVPGVGAVAAEHNIPVVAGFGAVECGGVDLGACGRLLSPGTGGDGQLLARGARPEQLARWTPGVDPECFGPGHYDAAILDRDQQRINVLLVGTPEAPEALAAAMSAANAIDPRLQLVRVDPAADLPRLFASADLLLHHSSSLDFPLSIIEAQASGLPVLAVDLGAARELVQDGRTGVLVPPDPRALAEAMLSLARRARMRERLTVGGLSAVRHHSWQRSLAELSDVWTAALSPTSAGLARAA